MLLLKMRGSSRSRSLSDEGAITDIGRHAEPRRQRRQIGQKRAQAAAQTKKIGRTMRKWLTMCWGGGASSNVSKEDLERAREKERLILVDSDDEGEEQQQKESSGMLGEKRKAYVPQYAGAAFLRTATSRPMKQRNEVL